MSRPGVKHVGAHPPNALVAAAAALLAAGLLLLAVLRADLLPAARPSRIEPQRPRLKVFLAALPAEFNFRLLKVRARPFPPLRVLLPAPFHLPAPHTCASPSPSATPRSALSLSRIDFPCHVTPCHVCLQGEWMRDHRVQLLTQHGMPPAWDLTRPAVNSASSPANPSDTLADMEARYWSKRRSHALVPAFPAVPFAAEHSAEYWLTLSLLSGTPSSVHLVSHARDADVVFLPVFSSLLAFSFNATPTNPAALLLALKPPDGTPEVSGAPSAAAAGEGLAPVFMKPHLSEEFSHLLDSLTKWLHVLTASSSNSGGGRAGVQPRVVLPVSMPRALPAFHALLPSLCTLTTDFSFSPLQDVNFMKDVIIPYAPIVEPYLDDPGRWSDRTTLLYFRGSTEVFNNGRELRRSLAKLFSAPQWRQGVVFEAVERRDESEVTVEDVQAMQHAMRRSLFCLVPEVSSSRLFNAMVSGCIPVVVSDSILVPFKDLTSYSSPPSCTNAGNTVSSSRLFNAMVSGCIPVVVSDSILLPFEDLIDYTRFALFMPSHLATRSGYLASVLRLEESKWRAMWQELRQVQRHFIFGSPAAEGGAEDMVWQALLRKQAREAAARERAAWQGGHVGTEGSEGGGIQGGGNKGGGNQGGREVTGGGGAGGDGAGAGAGGGEVGGMDESMLPEFMVRRHRMMTGMLAAVGLNGSAWRVRERGDFIARQMAEERRDAGRSRRD
ncbi:unnamed protein product [Closterium sp. Yama58-4]|nr:unnamed protein product [Closterium sp. Yama58-4]